MPLYTIGDAAEIVDVPPSTLASWAKGYIRRSPTRPDVRGEPVITYIEPRRQRDASIPFVGLVEALVLAAIRRGGVPLQRVRPALAELERTIGIQHALASRRLFTDGAELLFDFAAQHADTDEGKSVRDLVVVRNGQRVFAEVIDEYLQRIQYAADGYPELIKVPRYGDAQVIADPRRSFGDPIFERGGARVKDVLERFWAGESIDDLTEEFGVPADQLEEVLRAASRRAA